jgi:hypothetical protein
MGVARANPRELTEAHHEKRRSSAKVLVKAFVKTAQERVHDLLKNQAFNGPENQAAECMRRRRNVLLIQIGFALRIVAHDDVGKQTSSNAWVAA